MPAGSAPGGRCLVRLHGKGGSGAATVTDGDVTVLAPTGNADGWGARQWLYFPDDEYDGRPRPSWPTAVAGCDEIIVNGFSNGGAFAAKLYCRGETFDGRLVRVVVDDPVVDHGVEGCAPDPAVDVTLYWTGALELHGPAGLGLRRGRLDVRGRHDDRHRRVCRGARHRRARQPARRPPVVPRRARAGGVVSYART